MGDDIERQVEEWAAELQADMVDRAKFSFDTMADIEDLPPRDELQQLLVESAIGAGIVAAMTVLTERGLLPRADP